MNIIIPIGGKGERFKPTYSMPKPLIPVLNKPILFHIIDNLDISPEDKVFIIYYINLETHGFTTRIQETYPNIQCIPVYHQTAGAAETIYCGLQQISKLYPHTTCVLLDCDTFYTANILGAVRASPNKNMVFYVPRPPDTPPIYSYIQLNEHNVITCIREKQKVSNNANTGCYVFADIEGLINGCKHIMDNSITFNGEPYTSCVIDHLIRDHHTEFAGHQLTDTQVYSLGTPRELETYLRETAIFLFDMDGTIINTDKIYFKVWTQILKDFNVELDHDIFIKYIQGHNDVTVLKYFIGDVETDEEIISTISTIKDHLFMEYINEIEYIPGILEFMETLKSRGHHISIVTNANRITAQHIIDKCGFSRYIDHLVIGNECVRPKPYADPYIKAIQLYGEPTETKVYVFEDSMSGLLSARQCETHCIIGVSSAYDDETLKNNGANIVIDNYIGSQQLLDQLLKYTANHMETIKRHIKNSLPYNDIISVDINETKLKGGFISDVIEVSIKRQSTTHHCVCKLVNTNETNLSIMAEKLGLYQRENYFYDALSRYVNVAFPKFYGLVRNDEMETIGILLENMNKDPCMQLNLDLNKEDIGVSLGVIEELAKMHAKFWNKPLKTAFPGLKTHADPLFKPVWKDFIDEKWPIFKQVWGKVLSTSQMEFMENVKTRFQDIQDALSQDNLTLIHGDVKSPNIFYDVADDYRPCFLDWQYIAIGKGCQDVIFFLIESFTVEKIGLYYPIFKNYYYAMLLKYGVENYSFETYEKDMKNSALYFPYFVAIWFGTVPEDDLIDKNFPFFFIKKLTSFYAISQV